MQNTASKLLLLLLAVFSLTVQAQKLKLSLEKKVLLDSSIGHYVAASETQEWNPNETAIIICDMWNQHWCKGATSRVAEMAPAMNKVITDARKKGVLIVHAPSDCMAYYKGTPGRLMAEKYKDYSVDNLVNENKLPTEKNMEWPIDQFNGGCNCSPACKEHTAWNREINLLEIKDGDAISDSGVELAGLFNEKGIKNVILMGVHTNMCVIGRSFGLRNMTRLGKNVVLMRDMTDTMYDSRQWPHVSHFAGTALIVQYIEKYVCPTIVSTDITGKKPFKFNTSATM